jgi:hypothetical protein
MPEAVAQATSHGIYIVPARNLFYRVRELIQGVTNKELDSKYFGQTLLVEYQRIFGEIPGLVRDPRGNLLEPHTGTTVPLGTQAVAKYRFPDYVFNKILYTEKEGFADIFQHHQLAERYDLAIASGKGFPVVAVRDLFARAWAGNYRLFVLHDADPAGYGIARTIAEETDRMPGYSVEVVDLGLTVADAIDRNLPREAFVRTHGLQRKTSERFNELERDWFVGTRGHGSQYLCHRVELNAFNPPDLVAYIEDKLAANGADDKIVPPEFFARSEAGRKHHIEISVKVADEISRLIDTYAITRTIVDETAEVTTDPLAWVTEANANNPACYWRNAVRGGVVNRLSRIDARVRERARELVNEAMVEHVIDGGDREGDEGGRST